MPVRPPPSVLSDELAPLLDEQLTSALSQPLAGRGASDGIRNRLSKRIATSLRELAPMITVRAQQCPAISIETGVVARELYRAKDVPLRPGEPIQVLLIDMAANAVFRADQLPMVRAGLVHIEWLVIRGDAQVDGISLSQRDFHVTPPGWPAATWSSAAPARLFVRRSPAVADELPLSSPLTVTDSEAGWPQFAPGIKRRVLWQRGHQASMLYYAEPGLHVPQHRHGHDEECLMLQGDLFLDDQLLQTGDYQLAPAGTGHRRTETDTGAVIFAHGDLNLDFVG